MKWIKASERLPNIGKLVAAKRNGEQYGCLESENDKSISIYIGASYGIYGNDDNKLEDIEWLDESPQPSAPSVSAEEMLRKYDVNIDRWPDTKKLIIQAMQEYAQAQQGKVLPSIEHSGVIALQILEKVSPKLNENEEALFIAGFQECIKYLSTPPNQ